MEIIGCFKLMVAVFGPECIESVSKNWLKELTLREKRVIELRYGLADDDKSRTLEEVGNEFSLTRERIRQIERDALRRIRSTITSDYFISSFLSSKVESNIELIK